MNDNIARFVDWIVGSVNLFRRLRAHFFFLSLSSVPPTLGVTLLLFFSDS